MSKDKSSLNEINNLLNVNNAIISFSDIESFHYSFAEGLLSGLHGFCRGWRDPDPKEFWEKWCYSNEKSLIRGVIDWGTQNIQKRTETAKNNSEYIIANFSKETIGEKYYNQVLKI